MPNKCHGDGSKDARSAVAPTFIKVSHEPWLRVFFSCCFGGFFWRGHDVHPLNKKKKSTPASPASLRFAVSPSCSPRSSHGRYIDLFIFLPIRRVCPLCAFPASSFGFSKKKKKERRGASGSEVAHGITDPANGSEIRALFPLLRAIQNKHKIHPLCRRREASAKEIYI